MSNKSRPSRMSSSAARAEGAARTSRIQAAALASVDRNIAELESHPASGNRASGRSGRSRLSGLDHAARILAGCPGPLRAGEIVERAVASGWHTAGKTPAATLASAIRRDIAANGNASNFRIVGRGLFTVIRGAPAGASDHARGK